jgi:uncharacterized protein (DUF1697 family)
VTAEHREASLSKANSCTMPRYIAFLRAINLGGNRVAKNDVLRQVFELLGFSGITTFFASGNVAFVARRSDVGRLETKIEE